MITKTTTNTKCDVRDCKNNAVFFIPAKGRCGKFFLCDECFRKLRDDALRAVTPKSPKNTIKRKMEESEFEDMTE